MTAIVIIGPPGSGKSTLAEGLSSFLRLPLISSGDIARQLAQTDIHAQAGLARGDWAPESAMRSEVLAQVEAAQLQAGDFVIEGFPRRVEQLYILEAVPSIDPLYFSLEIDPLICVRRVIARKRSDLHPDAEGSRWRAWQEYTQPMLEMLHNVTHMLDGIMPPEDLIEDVVGTYYTHKRERD